MTQRTNIILAATTFLGGLATGLLLAPKKGSQYRAWVSDHATGLVDWADIQHQNVRRISNSKLDKIRKNLQQGIKKNVPNLFEATEDIHLSKSEIFPGE